MGFFLLLGLCLVGVSVAFMLRAYAVTGLKRGETLAQIASYGFSAGVAAEQVARQRQGLRQLVDGLARVVGKPATLRLGPAREAEARAILRGAGLYQTDIELFIGYRLLVAAGLPAFYLLMSASSGSLGFRGLIIVSFIATMGWVLPSFILKRRAAARLEQIDLEMPELVDLLVTTVEAGIGFTSGLQLVARRVEGPLGQELRIALREQAMGLTIEDALQNMLARQDSTSIRAFVQAIIQGQKLGVSIGKILRDLAVDMRKRRRQLAEERAQKAPTKILFPLVFLILPALFIVVLGGPIIGLGKTLGGLS